MSISYTLEEVIDIIKHGFADTTNRQIKDIDVYNVQNVGGNSYTYDASVYFREDTEKDLSDSFKTLVETQVETFKGILLDKVREKVREKKAGVIPDLETYVNTNVQLSIDTQSGRFSQSFNKGKARPDFDAIIPTIEMGATDITTEDYLEIKDFVCVKSDTNVSVSFKIRTNMVGQRIDYRIKLSEPGVVQDGSTEFDSWMKTTPSQGANGHATYVSELAVSGKTITSSYTTSSQWNPTFNPTDTYRVHVKVYFFSEQSFSVYHTTLV